MPKSKRPPQKNKKSRASRKALPAKKVSVPKTIPVEVPAVQPRSIRILGLRRKPKMERSPVVGAFRLFGRSLLVLKRHWKLFTGITVVYAILNVVLVHGLASNGNLDSIKSAVDGAVGSGAKLSGGLTLFVYLLGGSSSANSANANAGVYQTLLIIIVSLTLIWSLRQVYNNQQLKIRDGFYRGIYPAHTIHIGATANMPRVGSTTDRRHFIQHGGHQ